MWSRKSFREKAFFLLRWALLCIFLLAAIWWLKPGAKTVDFGGVVQAVSTENGVVYVTAVQALSEFTVEIAIPAKVRVKTADGAYSAAEIRAGDRIWLNFRKKPQKVNGVWRALAKGTITVLPAHAAANAQP